MRRLCIWVTVLGLILTGCQPKSVPTGPFVKKIDSEELSRLMINYSVALKKEQHLSLEDSWVSYDDTIKKICVRFSSQRLLTVEQARLQIVEVVEGLLARVNNHSVLSFELERFPITARELDIKINYESFHGRYVDELYMGLTWLQAGCVHFYAFDRKDNNLDRDHSRFEPYFKSRELALLKKEADLPFTDKSKISNQVNVRALDRYESYSTNKFVYETCESQPRPKPIVLIPGRDSRNDEENISTIIPVEREVFPGMEFEIEDGQEPFDQFEMDSFEDWAPDVFDGASKYTETSQYENWNPPVYQAHSPDRVEQHENWNPPVYQAHSPEPAEKHTNWDLPAYRVHSPDPAEHLHPDQSLIQLKEPFSSLSPFSYEGEHQDQRAVSDQGSFREPLTTDYAPMQHNPPNPYTGLMEGQEVGHDSPDSLNFKANHGMMTPDDISPREKGMANPEF
jgi:hypothetical protein